MPLTLGHNHWKLFGNLVCTLGVYGVLCLVNFYAGEAWGNPISELRTFFLEKIKDDADLNRKYTALKNTFTVPGMRTFLDDIQNKLGSQLREHSKRPQEISTFEDLFYDRNRDTPGVHNSTATGQPSDEDKFRNIARNLEINTGEDLAPSRPGQPPGTMPTTQPPGQLPGQQPGLLPGQQPPWQQPGQQPGQPPGPQPGQPPPTPNPQPKHEPFPWWLLRDKQQPKPSNPSVPGGSPPSGTPPTSGSPPKALKSRDLPKLSELSPERQPPRDNNAFRMAGPNGANDKKKDDSEEKRKSFDDLLSAATKDKGDNYEKSTKKDKKDDPLQKLAEELKAQAPTEQPIQQAPQMLSPPNTLVPSGSTVVEANPNQFWSASQAFGNLGMNGSAAGNPLTGAKGPQAGSQTGGSEFNWAAVNGDTPLENPPSQPIGTTALSGFPFVKDGGYAKGSSSGSFDDMGGSSFAPEALAKKEPVGPPPAAFANTMPSEDLAKSFSMKAFLGGGGIGRWVQDKCIVDYKKNAVPLLGICGNLPLPQPRSIGTIRGEIGG
ncbi:MAG: hypothetical protein HY537_08385 [Deltaproteobacteria bacterium]|nr:hypothetical protein [Deltaproteobacteria bacterium]